MRSSLCKSTLITSVHILALLWLTLFCLISTPQVAAQYRFDILNTDSGLPQNSVYSILQTRDGYLWFSTLDGLVRYDGASFRVFNRANTKGINSNRIQCLFEDRDDVLWIGTEDGGLTRHSKGVFTTYTTEHGLLNNTVLQIRQAKDGALLVMTVAGLMRFDSEKFEVISRDVFKIEGDIGHQGPTGTTWHRVGGELRRIQNGSVTTYKVAGGGRGNLTHNQVFEDRQGRLWLGVWQKGELLLFKDGSYTTFTVKNGLPPALFVTFCEDRKGAIWWGTDGGGLVRFKDGNFTTYTTEQGLSSNDIDTIFEDREGTIWVGTHDNGVTRLTRPVITTYSEKDGMVGKIFYPIIEDRSGCIWTGYEGMNRFKDGKFTYYPLNITRRHIQARESFATIQALYEDREGSLWIGHNRGLITFKDEKFTNRQEITERGWIYAIYQDSQGALWIGFDNALMRYKDGEVKRFGFNDGFRDLVQPIYEDRQGRIWIGSYGGLAQYVDGRLVFYTERDGLSTNRIRSIYEDSDGVLWIGTYDGGLNRFQDGKFTSYTMKEGMFSNGVFAILEDPRGNFWMSSNQGIYRVRKQQLNDFAEGRIKRIHSVSYGKADGMLNTECNGGRHPAGIKTRDGRLWFPTFNGIAIVDPEAAPFNSVPPPAMIENAILDREELDISQPVEIRPGKNDLEIHYTALSFIKTDHIQFKYKLEGLDRDWVEVGNRREAYYSHLPAGAYTFRVIAANSDGVWNEEGTRLLIKVLPPFYSTWWFLTLSALAVTGAGLLLYRRRISKLQKARIAQEAFSRQLISSQEGERKRIAAELHDSLGQNLLVIKNWATMARRSLEPECRAREPLDEIASAVSHSIEEVREIAYNLRPYHLDETGLTEAIQSMLEKVAEPSNIRFTAEIDPIDRLLSADSEINLYRVIQESVNNIIKHSEATAAGVMIKRDSDSIRIVIKDDGKGFELQEILSKKDHGFGLTGIMERVRLLQGRESIQSAPGNGTTITIILDLRKASSEL